MKVPLNPISRQEIHLLETVLLVSALFDPEVMEMIKDPSERVTWIDSLAVAAGAFARRKAGMSVVEIADELGRSEATIRNHLEGKTKAGQIIQKVYERLVKEGGEVKFEVIASAEKAKKLEKAKAVIEEVITKLEDLLKELE